MKHARTVSGGLFCLILALSLISTAFSSPQPTLRQTSELDLLGDTVHVGSTNWELQHITSVGRWITFDPAHQQGPQAYVAWTGQTSGGPNPNRHVAMNQVLCEDEMMVNQQNEIQVDGDAYAGFATLVHTMNDRYPVCVYHSIHDDAESVHPVIGEYWDVMDLYMSSFTSDYEEASIAWPKSAYAEYNGEGFLHIVATENVQGDDPTTERMVYTRCSQVEDSPDWETPEWQLVTDQADNHAATVAVSQDGERVAVAVTCWRGGDDYSPVEMDLLLWQSEDGGETWEWENPYNVTAFIDGGYSEDTLRAYNDIDLYFDHENVLHVAFTTIGIDRDNMSNQYPASILWHWDEESMQYTRIADGWFTNHARTMKYHPTACRPSLVQDPNTGTLYCTWMQAGLPGEYTQVNDSTYHAWDRSEYDYINYEILLSASPGMANGVAVTPGKLWTVPVNLTNTRAGEGEYPNGIPEGEGESEVCPNLALNTDDDHLFLSYVVDRDAGWWDADQGSITDNPVVLQRVAFDDIMNVVYDSAAWLPNIPLHVNHAGFYQDPWDWAWNPEGRYEDPFHRTLDVEEAPVLQPTQFHLAQNHPNPFNPATELQFTLETRGAVQLVVHDLLGREVQVLTDRVHSAGTHTRFFDATGLPSGTYFATLSSGEHRQTVKMLLLK